MDDLNCSGDVVFQTLRELEIINKFLGGNKVTIDAIGKLIKNRKTNSPIVVVDIGCGGGDILGVVREWGRKMNLTFELHGIDANPNIIAFAALHDKKQDIDFQALDVFSEDFVRRKYDIILATLFAHHFTESQLITLLRRAKEQASIGIVINDLHVIGLHLFDQAPHLLFFKIVNGKIRRTLVGFEGLFKEGSSLDP